MGPGARQPKRRRARRQEPSSTDDDLGPFLADVTAVEADDPDEPERWAEFFRRLRALAGHGGEPSP